MLKEKEEMMEERYDAIKEFDSYLAFYKLTLVARTREQNPELVSVVYEKMI